MGLSLRGQSSGAIDINAPNAAGNNTITLPGSNGAANQFYKNSGTAGTLTHSSMIELSNGRIGIGTDDPGSPLEVNGGSGLDVATFNSHNADGPLINVQRSGTAIGFVGSGKNLHSATGSVDALALRSQAEFTIATGGSTERLRITSDGDVGVGVIGPEALLHVEENLSHSSTYYLNSDAHILIDNPSSDVTSKSVLKLEGEAAIVYGNGSGTLIFADRQNERLRITSAGKLILPTGSPGIQFGSSDNPDPVGGNDISSQTLDDYEEGTWTPTLSNFTLGNGILTGQYTKIGNIVHLTFRLDAGSTTTFTGAASGMAGFPFTNVLASNTGYLTASNPSNNWFGWTQQYSIGAASNFLQWVTSSSNHQVGSATQPFTWGSSTIMRFNMTYRAG